MSSPNTPGRSSISVTATVTALLALTTPFQQPTGCDSHFTTTSLISTYLDGTTYTVPLVVSERVNSCYPSGWDSVVPESRLCFSPAVCPSGWTYYSMEENRQAASTAYCCDSGYSFVPTELNIVSDVFSTACGRWISSNDVSVDSEYGITMTVETFVVHEAWAITWMSDDRSTLTPLLPALTYYKRLPIWTPDQTPGQTPGQTPDQDTPDVKYDPPINDRRPFLDGPEMVMIIVVLPVLSFVGILSCIGCCVASRIRRKRRERVALERAETENEAVTTSVGLQNMSPRGSKQ